MIEEKLFECTPLLQKKIIESTKNWLDKEEIKYQELLPTTQGIIIQTEKNKLIINLGFEPHFPIEPYFPIEASIIIANGENGKKWEDPNIQLIDGFGILFPESFTPSNEEKNYLNEMSINIFKIIEDMIKIERFQGK